MSRSAEKRSPFVEYPPFPDQVAEKAVGSYQHLLQGAESRKVLFGESVSLCCQEHAEIWIVPCLGQLRRLGQQTTPLGLVTRDFGLACLLLSDGLVLIGLLLRGSHLRGSSSGLRCFVVGTRPLLECHHPGDDRNDRHQRGDSSQHAQATVVADLLREAFEFGRAFGFLGGDAGVEELPFIDVEVRRMVGGPRGRPFRGGRRDRARRDHAPRPAMRSSFR